MDLKELKKFSFRTRSGQGLPRELVSITNWRKLNKIARIFNSTFEKCAGISSISKWFILKDGGAHRMFIGEKGDMKEKEAPMKYIQEIIEELLKNGYDDGIVFLNGEWFAVKDGKIEGVYIDNTVYICIPSDADTIGFFKNPGTGWIEYNHVQPVSIYDKEVVLTLLEKNKDINQYVFYIKDGTADTEEFEKFIEKYTKFIETVEKTHIGYITKDGLFVERNDGTLEKLSDWRKTISSEQEFSKFLKNKFHN